MSQNVRLAAVVGLSFGVLLLFFFLAPRERPPRPGPHAASGDAATTAAAPGPPAASAAAGGDAAAPAPDGGAAVDGASAVSAPGRPGEGPPASATVSAESAAEPAAPGPAPAGEARARLENEAVVVEISTTRGAVASWKLKERRFGDGSSGPGAELDLVGSTEGVLGISCCYRADLDRPGKGDCRFERCPVEYEIVSRTADGVVLESRDGPGTPVHVQQVYALGSRTNPYEVRKTVVLSPARPGEPVRNLVVWTWVAAPAPKGQPSGGFLTPATNQQGGLCRYGGDLSRTNRGGVTTASRYRGVLSWVGVDDTYFLSSVGVTERERLGSEQPKDLCLLTVAAALPRSPLFAKLQLQELEDLVGKRTFSFVGYLGPKTLDLLRDVPALGGLDEAIDYGWFGFLAVPMLRVMEFFYSLLGSWGIAIILLTVVVKLILLPLTHWSTVSMRRMAALKPLLDEINEKYKDDKQRRNQAIMDLYKMHKVNPLGGCFPILLQMPIWIALYRMLGASAELYHVRFLYLADLTTADPYFILPAVLGVSMFIQQKITPTTADSAQAKVMLYGMPIMFTVFMLFLPSGLNVYIFTNTVLSIVQQQLINRFVPAPVLAAAKGAPPAAPPGTAAAGEAKVRAGGSSRRRKR